MKRIYGSRVAINHPVEKSLLRQKIVRSDRVICLGHGAPQGLFGFNGLVIDEDDAELFRAQPDNIYIWCNADCYLRSHGLKGFATGMFISEPMEAMIFNVNASYEDIEDSNNLFADVVGNSLELPTRKIREKILDEYQINNNKVVAYNRERMHYFE